MLCFGAQVWSRVTKPAEEIKVLCVQLDFFPFGTLKLGCRTKERTAWTALSQFNVCIDLDMSSDQRIIQNLSVLEIEFYLLS